MTDEPQGLLSDPNAVHLNMLAGKIAKPSWEQILHLYQPQGRVIWADGPPPDELKDGREVLLKSRTGSASTMFWNGNCWIDNPSYLDDDDIIAYARLD